MHHPFLRVPVAVLRGSRSFTEDRWVNWAKIVALAPSGGGSRLHIREVGPWQVVVPPDRIIERRPDGDMPASARMLGVQVAVLQGNQSRAEDRWISSSQVVTVQPAEDGCFAIHVEGLGRWQCIGTPADLLAQLQRCSRGTAPDG